MLEEMVDKELEDQLREAGEKLRELPSDVEELLSLLDEIESCLSRVEQSPSKLMQNALSPSLNALVATDLVRHANRDVKVSVASCVSEITRITAPDAPYGDDQMKKIFQLIVDAFEMLSDTSSRSYQKRVSILETVAKVRSCVVMLDLECDVLIQEMFQYFLKSVRDEHPPTVFSSMETIMSLVLEESEEIPPELLYPLLTSVKKENQGVLPVARKLGEKVLETCTSKVKPYLMHAIKSMGMSPKDFSKIVVSICQETSDTTEHNDDSVSVEHLDAERILPDKVASDKLPQVEEPKSGAIFRVKVDMVSEKSVTIVTSNGDTQNVKDDSLVGIDSPKKKEELSQSAPQVDQVESDNLDPKMAKGEDKLDQPAKKKRGRKSNSSNQMPEAPDQSKIEIDNEITDLPSQRTSQNKDDNSLTEDQSIDKSPSVTETESLAPGPSPVASRDKPLKIASPSPSQSLPDGAPRKRGRPKRTKKGNTKENTDHGSGSGSGSVPNEVSEQVESADAFSKKGPEEVNEMEEKSNTRSGKKVQSDKETEKSSGATSDSEEKPLKRSGKKVDVRGSKGEESSPKEQGAKPSKGKNHIPEKDLPGESSKKKTTSSVKSTEKSKNQNQLEETPKTQSKRKRTGKEETSEKPSGKDLGENVVGSRIQVWWPDDEMFYVGVIESFDPKKKKHKVLYDDGEVEILKLEKERWEYVNNTELDEGQEPDLSSPDAASKRPKKKAKTKSDSGSKHTEANASEKRGKETSTSKSKDEASKSSRRSKDDGKINKEAVEDTPNTASNSKNDGTGKSKRNTPKTGSKSKDDTHKTVTNGKDDTPKAGTKDKSDTPKGVTKLKVTTPKTSAKAMDVSPNTGTKSKEATPKTGTKSKDATPKTGNKSRDATPKTGNKSKDDTPKTETKSQDETSKTRTKTKKATPKTGSKAGANGNSGKGQPEDAGKGKSLESKAQESEAKSGKKRRRVNE